MHTHANDVEGSGIVKRLIFLKIDNVIGEKPYDAFFVNAVRTSVFMADMVEVNPLAQIFSKSSKNLIVSINGTTDKVTIQNWHSGYSYQTEEFHTSDWRLLLNNKVEQLIHAMAAFSADNGMSWSDAIQKKPQETQMVLAQYWEPNR